MAGREDGGKPSKSGGDNSHGKPREHAEHRANGHAYPPRTRSRTTTKVSGPGEKDDERGRHQVGRQAYQHTASLRAKSRSLPGVIRQTSSSPECGAAPSQP